MKLNYVYIDTYRTPTHIQTHFHNCMELVYYHHTTGYITWKHSTQQASNSLVFMDKETGIYEQLDFSDNTLLIIPPNILHDEKHFSSSKVTAIGFTPEKENSVFFHSRNPILFLDHKKIAYEYICKIEKEYSKRSPFYQEMICLLLNRCLAEIDKTGISSTKDKLLEETKHYIDEHFSHKIKIGELAPQFFYCPDYFSKIFKEKFGLTPKVYIQEKRLEYAKKLIMETELTLNQISELCGFSDYIQFSKFYKKKEGISPSQVRNTKE